MWCFYITTPSRSTLFNSGVWQLPAEPSMNFLPATLKVREKMMKPAGLPTHKKLYSLFLLLLPSYPPVTVTPSHTLGLQSALYRHEEQVWHGAPQRWQELCGVSGWPSLPAGHGLQEPAGGNKNAVREEVCQACEAKHHHLEHLLPVGYCLRVPWPTLPFPGNRGGLGYKHSLHTGIWPDCMVSKDIW